MVHYFSDCPKTEVHEAFALRRCAWDVKCVTGEPTDLFYTAVRTYTVTPEVRSRPPYSEFFIDLQCGKSCLFVV